MIAPRRAFLQGLAALPLIGGGVTLIGNPRAVAVPITSQLLNEYHDWLGFERWRISQELSAETEAAFGRLHFDTPAASTRAALVLSTVGSDWRPRWRE